VEIETNPVVGDTMAENFLRLLKHGLENSGHGGGGKLDELERKTMEKSLMLYAEHGFNASTFAVKVCTATNTDIYSAITTGIGTLKGPLHGAANEWAIELLHELKSVEDADKRLTDMLARKEKIYGFGHRVYKKVDPRSDIIKHQSKLLTEREGAT